MEIIRSDKVMTLIGRTMNHIDSRLVDHELRVMMVLRDMLKTEGVTDKVLENKLMILALLHDVGAYRTEVIDNLVKFETGDVWAHSIYGYLFLREFTPLGEWSKVILYHHADFDGVKDENSEIMHYANMLHIADRAVVWHDAVKRPPSELKEHLNKKKGTVFAPDCVEIFMKADSELDTLAELDNLVSADELIDCAAIGAAEAEAYLTMVVHTIDFRSHVTVTHTMSVMEIASRLAKKMGLSEETIGQIRYGALLHDLGKIAIPVSILEKPGKLTDEEFMIMRNHVVLSGEIINGCVDEKVKRIAVRHHEKLDGSGYPLGLSANELTIPERILAVADIASALCMSRSYKEAFPKERSLGILRGMREKGEIDGSIMDIMEENFDEIISESDEACRPVIDAYERIKREFNRFEP